MLCEGSVGYDDKQTPHEGIVCERSYAIEYGSNGTPNLDALQAIATIFHRSGWTYQPVVASETEGGALRGIASEYANTERLDYTDMGYTKGKLYAHFRLATNNIGQPAVQNFCDVLCKTIHANKTRYQYFVEIYVRFKEYKYVDGWHDPNN